jgi:hypothetical protein
MRCRFATIEWLKGKVAVEPDIAREERRPPPYNSVMGDSWGGEVWLSFVLIVTRDSIKENIMNTPVEIQESLVKLQADHPDGSKVAFIMMQFGTSTGHDKIVDGIRKALGKHGLTGLRADDKQYHDDLFWNIITYIYGCGFGIAVFERLLSDDFNPNVSLEVGYMMALRKQICLLKDQTLTNLHADLVGKLYRPFDTQDPVKTIPPQLESWMKDKGIVLAVR